MQCPESGSLGLWSISCWSTVVTVRLQDKLDKLTQQQKTMKRATKRKIKIIQEETVSWNHQSCLTRCCSVGNSTGSTICNDGPTAKQIQALERDLDQVSGAEMDQLCQNLLECLLKMYMTRPKHRCNDSEIPRCKHTHVHFFKSMLSGSLMFGSHYVTFILISPNLEILQFITKYHIN